MTSSGIILQCGVNDFVAEREVRTELRRERRHADARNMRKPAKALLDDLRSSFGLRQPLLNSEKN
jgi:hypothetical protein